MSKPRRASDRLIVALDLPDADQARAMAARLGDCVGVYKIGLELAFVGGIDLARELVDAGRTVFLDLKLHDIPRTVERACAQVARLGVRFLTVHAYPQTMQAALDGAGSSGLELLGVTVLTSCLDDDLVRAGYRLGVDDLVMTRVRQAQEIGLHGLVLSGQEVAQARSRVGERMILVTPGVRPAGSQAGDQKRVSTPAGAVAAGADYLVVGRPIMQARDPRAAAQAIVEEIEAGERV
ncbi:MAG TPA: orotidine-5'-phosphate decarboxylase [Beijerinckiaceae bacterium]|nr:orotidine-5'-phosphate decarboxylase [Beijerinckiaceae bacterium]